MPPPGYYTAPPAAARAGSGGMGGLLALLGGAAAVGSAWLPWAMLSAQPMDSKTWMKPIDLTSSAGGLANGNYLVAAGAVAAVCGLLLIMGAAKSPGLRLALALGAIGGAIGVGAVEYTAYNKINDLVTATNDSGFAIGWGLYVGAAAAVVAGLGGLLVLVSKPGAAGSGARPSAASPLIAVIAILAIAGAGVYGVSQSSKSNGGATPTLAPLSTPILSVTAEPTETVTEAPTEAVTEVPTETVTEAPTETVTDAPTAGPTAAGSFLTGGYSTPELAINQFVVDQGFTFDGDCATAEGTGYCSAAGDKVGSGVIYSVGLVGSDPEVWMLMRQVNGKWYVVDVAAATSSPPWS